MEILRRLLGKSAEEPGRASGGRRASHVTPSRVQRIAAPPLEVAPAVAPEPEPTPAVESEPAARASSAEPEAPPAEAEAKRADEPAPTPDAVAKAPEPEIAAQPPVEAPKPHAPAPPLTEIPTPKPQLTRQRNALTYGIASDVGIVRENNEDACFGMQWHSISVDDRPDFGLFIVADGMGGHLDGERAAGVAVQTLASEMIDSIGAPMIKDFNSGRAPTIMEALVIASDKANRAVIKSVPGGGTTLSAVAIVGNLAYLVHVGDSRAYLLYQDKIEQLTTDHTLVQRLVELNELTLEEAERYPQKNVLYRAIGQNEQLRMERLIRPMPAGAHLLICTDGLWDIVEDEAIRRITTEASSPQGACDSLVRLANARGSPDNVTVVILKAPGDDVNA